MLLRIKVALVALIAILIKRRRSPIQISKKLIKWGQTI
jgi:hypothetical protein